MKQSTIDRLPSASDASKLVGEEVHEEIHLLIINKINKAILKKKNHVDIEDVSGFDGNYASKWQHNKQAIFDYIDNDTDGIRSLLVNKGYHITDRKLIIIDERQEEIDGRILIGATTRFYRYTISWW